MEQKSGNITFFLSKLSSMHCHANPLINVNATFFYLNIHYAMFSKFAYLTLFQDKEKKCPLVKLIICPFHKDRAAFGCCGFIQSSGAVRMMAGGS